LESPEAIRAELVAQLTDSVRWTESIQRMAEAGAATFVELGAGDVLVGLVKRIARGSKRLAVSDLAGVRAYADWMRFGIANS
jgi:[acyl-carrier-protein] S-malonyltransferase